MRYEKRNGNWYMRQSKKEYIEMKRRDYDNNSVAIARTSIAGMCATMGGTIPRSSGGAQYALARYAIEDAQPVSRGTALTVQQEMGIESVPEQYVPEHIRRRGY